MSKPNVFLLSVLKRYIVPIAKGEKRVEYRSKRFCPKVGDILIIGFKEDGVWKPVLVAVSKGCRRVTLDEVEGDATTKSIVKNLYGDYITATEFDVLAFFLKEERAILLDIIGSEIVKSGSKKLSRKTADNVLAFINSILDGAGSVKS